MSDIQKNKKYFKKEDLMKRLDWLAANAEIHNDLLVQTIALDSIAWMKEQEAKWIHREDMDFIDKYNCTHFHGMCTNCGLVHDFIDGHTGQYLYCPQCGRSVKWE